MFESVNIVGSGRVGSAVAARLAEAGVDLRAGSADVDLVLLCVPDSAIAEVAAKTAPGPWVAHVSGATPLAALDPHALRFSVHPLQTFTLSRGAEQLDGAWAAVSGESADALAAGFALAETLRLRAFELDDRSRDVYHAGAAIASNYLVTLYRAASRLLEDAGAPPEALVPLMRQTIENGFELTGPLQRGDRETIRRHVLALAENRPELLEMYEALAGVTQP